MTSSSAGLELRPVGFSNHLSSDVDEPVHGHYRQHHKTSLAFLEDNNINSKSHQKDSSNWGRNSVGPTSIYNSPTASTAAPTAGKTMTATKIIDIRKARCNREGIMKSFKVPKLVREFLAETLGTFLLVLFGDAAIAQVVLGKGTGKGDFFGGFQSIAIGYGFALIIGIMASGGVSGGHLNPAVTLTMAVLKKCKWIQVPVYMAGQYIGAFLASAVLYGTYADAINKVEGDNNRTSATYGIFASYPFPLEQSGVTLAFDQILGTALLLIIILAVTDKKNMGVIPSLYPLFIGFGLFSIHMGFGLNAGCAINPARDFSPRLFTLMAGWGSETFSSADFFFWIPFILPHIGGIIGGILYQFMVELHHPNDDEF